MKQLLSRASLRIIALCAAVVLFPKSYASDFESPWRSVLDNALAQMKKNGFASVSDPHRWLITQGDPMGAHYEASDKILYFSPRTPGPRMSESAMDLGLKPFELQAEFIAYHEAWHGLADAQLGPAWRTGYGEQNKRSAIAVDELRADLFASLMLSRRLRIPTCAVANVAASDRIVLHVESESTSPYYRLGETLAVACEELSKMETKAGDPDRDLEDVLSASSAAVKRYDSMSSAERRNNLRAIMITAAAGMNKAIH